MASSPNTRLKGSVDAPGDSGQRFASLKNDIRNFSFICCRDRSFSIHPSAKFSLLEVLKHYRGFRS
jgi:hypothetical protein